MKVFGALERTTERERKREIRITMHIQVWAGGKGEVAL
jgi:hypothetical protein